ncbi:galactokinase [Nocardioides limicola]|uniref:galactokinase n=1 Tax=Nocardioides limicola TaxID=2803368 RepID=UPI0027DC2CBE|nr:galactokinase [Nocardioides sp. DJM-14]
MTVRWRAPGRVNLIGEHTDYNGGFTLPFAIDRSCTAEVRRAGRPVLVARSAQQPDAVEVPLTRGVDAAVPDWARYLLGPAWLLREQGVDLPGLEISVDSAVPVGAGLSSSAALVCAVTCAVVDELGLPMGPEAMLALTRAVENDVVGAPTGGMDQLASLRSQPDCVLFCDMRDLVTEAVPCDLAGAGLTVLVVDTRAPHRHADGEYAARRRGCEQAAAELGLRSLRDVDVVGLDAALARLDDPELRRYTRHVVTENQRVLDVVGLLRSGRLSEIGPQLSASHVSMRDDFRITVPEIDVAVDALHEAGALGARMTGGGFGGCTIGLLATEVADAAAATVRRAFDDAGFAPPVTFEVRPGPGAHRIEGT